ncbi:MAG: restriction endonuclease subunit S [Alcaligenaceae bacterium]|nr:restriction endonuclease subunit S [Alcaligenaceae bacterium]
MSLPRYPEYKDSGTVWLGKVPAHWNIKRIRFVAVMNPSKSELTEVDRETEVSFLPMEAIGDDGSINLERTRRISEVETGYTFFRNGDVTLAKITPCFENGKGALMQGLQGGIGFGSTELIVARPKPSEVLGTFLNCIFRSPNFRAQGEASMYGAGGQKRVPDDFVRNLVWSFPPVEEQTAIATFLDRETAKIDALIAEQEKLLTLLAEKRQATISHAVTKGLNPDVPMKDSGVEWLGEVPAHWDVQKLKRYLEFITSGSRGWAEHYADDGALFIRIGNLTRNSTHLDLSDIQRVAVPAAAEGERTKVRPGDVLFSITAYLGSVAVVPEELEPAFVSQHIALARLHKQLVLPAWVAYVALSWVGKTYLETQGYGGTKVQLSLDDVANFLLTVPPLEEQVTITAFLESEIAKIDTLSTEATRAITLLKERRSALISAAVTGKIDVREAA